MKNRYVILAFFYFWATNGNAQSTLGAKGWENHSVASNSISRHVQHPNAPKAIPIYDSIYNWNWDTVRKEYIYNYKVIDIKYNNKDSIVSEIYQSWNGHTWADSVQYQYFYNPATNKYTYWVENTWNGSAWVGSYQQIYTYNLNNYDSLILAQQWNGANWQDYLLTRYTYNINGLVISEAQYTWVRGNWENADSIVYSYNANNAQTK